MFKLPPKLADLALNFKTTGNLQDFVDHLIQTYDDTQQPFEIKQKIKTLPRDTNTLMNLLGMATEMLDGLRDKMHPSAF